MIVGGRAENDLPVRILMVDEGIWSLISWNLHGGSTRGSQTMGNTGKSFTWWILHEGEGSNVEFSTLNATVSYKEVLRGMFYT